MPDTVFQLPNSEGSELEAIVSRLRNRASDPALVPEAPYNDGVSAALMGADLEALSNRPVRDRSFADAVRSGLLLWNDDLPASHTLSQGIETETGSYWHGIMHRREPDYTNSKYWFRRAGDHPIFPQLRERAIEVCRQADGLHYADQLRQVIESNPRWDPFAFIDRCEEASLQGDREAIRLLEAIQLREVQLLLSHSYRNAVEG